MSRLDANRIGLSLGISMTALSLLCGILLLIIPDITMSIGNYIFHGLDLKKIAVKIITFRSLVFGGIVAFIWSYLIGYIFAAIYNKLSVIR